LEDDISRCEIEVSDADTKLMHAENYGSDAELEQAGSAAQTARRREIAAMQAWFDFDNLVKRQYSNDHGGK
jgi:hypothetical protein